MAGLSPGDLSLYHTIVVTSGDDEARLMTAVGSPNHHILVQMTDLRLATPVDRKAYGEPPNGFESVAYAITPLGKLQIPKLLKAAIGIRSKRVTG